MEQSDVQCSGARDHRGPVMDHAEGGTVYQRYHEVLDEGFCRSRERLRNDATPIRAEQGFGRSRRPLSKVEFRDDLGGLPNQQHHHARPRPETEKSHFRDTKLDKYDGTTSIDSFLDKFEICAVYNGWGEERFGSITVRVDQRCGANFVGYGL